jgi:soluble lytic murein transglycosylase-like protein
MLSPDDGWMQSQVMTDDPDINMRFLCMLASAALAIAPAATAQTAPLVESSAELSRIISAVDRGEPAVMDIAIVIEPLAALDALIYAHRYRITAELAARIMDTAVSEGLDPALGFRLVRVESVFKQSARGSQGALGLTQLMPATARAIDRSVRTEAQILDPTTNLRLGFRYLRSMIKRYDGNVRLGLLAYNRGQGSVDRALRAGRDPENGYSVKVLGTAAGPGTYIGLGLLARSGG